MLILLSRSTSSTTRDPYQIGDTDGTQVAVEKRFELNLVPVPYRVGDHGRLRAEQELRDAKVPRIDNQLCVLVQVVPQLKENNHHAKNKQVGDGVEGRLEKIDRGEWKRKHKSRQ